MKIFKWILIILVVLVVVIAGLLAYYGAFSKINVTEQNMGPYTLVYMEYKGSYSNAGKICNAVFGNLSKQGIKSTQGFGIYLDNPQTVKAADLRSMIGCVIDKKDVSNLKDLLKGLKVMKFEKGNCVVAEFPIKGDLSYMIGAIKAYPELMKYIEAKGYKMTAPPMEIYNMQSSNIHFVVKINK